MSLKHIWVKRMGFISLILNNNEYRYYKSGILRILKNYRTPPIIFHILENLDIEDVEPLAIFFESNYYELYMEIL